MERGRASGYCDGEGVDTNACYDLDGIGEVDAGNNIGDSEVPNEYDQIWQYEGYVTRQRNGMWKD
jgi:hypothetical protein